MLVFFLFKIFFFIIIGIVLRGTLPRYRFDNLIKYTWKNFFFLLLCVLIINLTLFFLMY